MGFINKVKCNLDMLEENNSQTGYEQSLSDVKQVRNVKSLADNNTTKKTKIVGQEEYTSLRTGETQIFNVVEIEDTDANFEKLWLGHILAAIDEIGNAKMKVLNYILDNREKSNNSLIITVSELAKKIGVSHPTVVTTLQILEKHEIIKRKTGAIFLSPNIVFKGGHKHRLNVLYKYKHFDE
jgi:DNA-binding transcriptional ArsR family regulator